MKKVLITGGSEGIGFAFAQQYAKQGDTLFLVARDQTKLEHAKQTLQEQYAVPVEIFSVDLSLPQSAENIFASFASQEIDVLINNAGVGRTGEALTIPNDEDEKLIQVNVTSLMVLTKCFAAQMKKRGSGMILNVASTGAFQPGPYQASYYASKAFVLSYTRALKEELKGSGVSVYCLCPGPTDTAFYEKSSGVMSRYHMSAEDCAVYAMEHMHTKTVLIPGWLNRFLFYAPVPWKIHWLAKYKK